MRILSIFIFFLIFIQGNNCFADESARNRVFYAGTKGVALRDILPLSDGTLLVSGSAQTLSWLPGDTRKIVLPADGIENPTGGASVGFLMHLSGDAEKVLACAALPPGITETLARVRTTNVPGQPTGDLFISGLTATGYFIGKLNNNFVKGAPSRFEWIHNVKATSNHRDSPVWDVGGDGKVLLASGEPTSPNWAAVYRLNESGQQDVVEDWRFHWGEQNGQQIEGAWTPASSRRDVRVTHSAIVFKVWGRPDLRSWTAQEYEAYTPDGNGGVRKGSWPLDQFFASSANINDLKSSSKGGGYTGYAPGRNPTARIGDIVVDRRDNNFYIGYCYQSRLPDGLPDFEPAILAMTDTGKLKWWSRLYHEFLDKNGNGRYDDGEPRNSTPDQYIDFLALDTRFNALVVGARCHGNNVINFWNGDKIASRAGAKGFKNQFTGTNGNIHISWLGKLGLEEGTLFAATYVAEMEDGMQGAGKPSDDPQFDGWPDPNAGWPNVNTTRLRGMSVDEQGRVLIAAIGRRTITTSNAYQKMLKKSEGVSTWNDFVRVYKPDLSGIEYSSLLTGTWDRQTGAGGGNIELGGVALSGGRVLAVGAHAAYTDQDIKRSIEDVEKRKRKLKPGDAVPQPLSSSLVGKIKGNAMPVETVPNWGARQPDGQSGLLALLEF